MQLLRATVLGLLLGAVTGCLVSMGAVAKFGPARDDSVLAYLTTAVGCGMGLQVAVRYLLEVARALRAARPRSSAVLSGSAWGGLVAFWVRAISFYASNRGASDHGAFEGLWLGLAEGAPMGAAVGAVLGFTIGAEWKPRSVVQQPEDLLA